MSIAALGTALAPYAGELLLGGGLVSLLIGKIVFDLGRDTADTSDSQLNICAKIAYKIAGFAIAVIGTAMGIASLLAIGVGIFAFGATLESLAAAVIALVTTVAGLIFVIMYARRALCF